MKKFFSIIIGIIIAFSTLGCGAAPPSPVADIKDLSGKIVACIGQGSPPAFTLKYVLGKAGLEVIEGNTRVPGKVSISYAADSAAAASFVVAGTADVACVAEPSVEDAIKAIGGKRLFDVQTLYNKFSETQNGYPQAALVVKSSLMGDTGAITLLTEKLKNSEEWLKNNIDSAIASLKLAGSTTIEKLDVKAIEGSNIGFKAENTKVNLEKYFGNILGTFLAPIGGKMPDEDFYGQFAQSQNAPLKKYTVYAPDGAPALCVASLIGNDFDVKVVPASQIGAAITQEKADFAILPTNLAANLYNKGAMIKILGITSFGNLYIVGA